MKLKTLISTSAGLMMVVFLASVSAHEGHDHDKGTAHSKMDSMMAKAKELGAPGAEHAVLNDLAGKWKVSSLSWMEPGKEPMKSSGTSTIGWILGNRFLKQDFSSEMMGEKFQGLGYLGYDKVKKEYISTWMDTMATGLFKSTGSYDAKTKTLNEKGLFSCPFQGRDVAFRSQWKIIDHDNNVFTMFMKDPKGKEVKSMEITYKRK